MCHLAVFISSKINGIFAGFSFYLFFPFECWKFCFKKNRELWFCWWFFWKKLCSIKKLCKRELRGQTLNTKKWQILPVFHSNFFFVKNQSHQWIDESEPKVWLNLNHWKLCFVIFLKFRSFYEFDSIERPSSFHQMSTIRDCTTNFRIQNNRMRSLFLIIAKIYQELQEFWLPGIFSSQFFRNTMRFFYGHILISKSAIFSLNDSIFPFHSVYVNRNSVYFTFFQQFRSNSKQK